MWPFIGVQEKLALECIKHYRAMKREEALLVEAKKKLLRVCPEDQLIKTSKGSVRVKELQRVRVDMDKVKQEIGIDNLLKLCNIQVNKLMMFMNNSAQFDRVVSSKTTNKLVIVNIEENKYGRKI